MSRIPSHRPVARATAGSDLGLLAVSFGVTVIVTRLYLMLTGYPQIGGGTFHIAHAVWGGLLLVVGSLLPLTWANRWVLTVTALCSGVGVGLFIDEVGKFITTRNDYFFPLAAPIIYLCVLAVLALARRASRARSWDARALTYLVLDRAGDVADGALSLRGRQDMLDRLAEIERDDRPDLAELARQLRPVVLAAHVREDAPNSGFQRRLAAIERVAGRWEHRLLPRPVHRLLLIVGGTVVGLISLVGIAVVFALMSDDPDIRLVIDERTVPKGSHPPALIAAAIGQSLIGVLLLAAVVLLAVRRDRVGTALLRTALMIGLAGVNVALGYVDAELVVVVALCELAGLELCRRYRSRFVTPVTPHAAAAETGVGVGIGVRA